MSEVMRTIEATMSAYHDGDAISDAELLQARIALESLAKAASYFGVAMRPVLSYANRTADDMRSMEHWRAERVKEAASRKAYAEADAAISGQQ